MLISWEHSKQIRVRAKSRSKRGTARSARPKFGRKKEGAVASLFTHRRIDEAAKSIGAGPTDPRFAKRVSQAPHGSEWPAFRRSPALERSHHFRPAFVMAETPGLRRHSLGRASLASCCENSPFQRQAISKPESAISCRRKREIAECQVEERGGPSGGPPVDGALRTRK